MNSDSLPLSNAVCLFESGKTDEAEVLCFLLKEMELNPDRWEIHHNLARLLAETAKPEQAIEHYKKAHYLKPDSTEILIDLAETYKNQRNFHGTVAACRKALKLDPENTRAMLILGDIYVDSDKIESAIPFYHQALALNPDSLYTHVRLGDALRQQGETAEALSHFQTAMKLDPENLTVRLWNCLAQIPLIYESEEEIVQARENYRKALEELCRNVDLDNPVVRDRAKTMVGATQPFYLAYHGENDRELQSMYGDLMVRVQSACFPEWAGKPPMPPIKSGEPIRVGILSGYFCRHSVWKILIKGWIENLNKDEFQLYGYYTGYESDTQTEIAKKKFYRFIEKLPTQEDWLKRITGDRLHIIIIPEVGMDPMTARLAAFPLAPVQCSSYGHPETTGFPTIDYYLGSDLMEPENGQDHYCEKLIRLPNLSIYYEPLDTPVASVDRACFGLRDDLPLFICTQSLFKYLPRYDEVFPRIALEAGECQFAFFGYQKSSALGAQFLRRLEKAFSRFSLRMEDYVKMFPYLDIPHYNAINKLADVFLDSIGFSGLTTTLEALACDLPVVAMPYKLMRGRQTHAILKMIDLCETGGRNIDEYVAIAARLAKEPGWRKEISEKIARNRHLLYRDMECIRGLEEFIRQAVRSHSRV